MIKSYVGNSSSHCIQTVHAGHSRIQAGSLCGVSLEKEKTEAIHWPTAKSNDHLPVHVNTDLNPAARPPARRHSTSECTPTHSTH